MSKIKRRRLRRPSGTPLTLEESADIMIEAIPSMTDEAFFALRDTVERQLEVLAAVDKALSKESGRRWMAAIRQEEAGR